MSRTGYTAKELHEKLERAGLKVVRSTSFVTVLLPVMLLSRLSRKDYSAEDMTNELRLNPVLNKAFELLMRLDLGLIKLGVDLPFGGSRLVVARKKI